MASNAGRSVQKYSDQSWFLECLYNWTLSSSLKLCRAENCLLSYLKMPHRGFHVDIGAVVGKCDQIWTVSLNEQDTKLVPIVALHGLGAGLAHWLLNLEALARERTVYAMDVLGFGRSSRPLFAREPASCEQQLVEALEAWRAKLKLHRMILLGHSMGAFIASSYALRYADRVQHLVLADAWGYAERPVAQMNALPLWVRIVGRISLWCNPYWIVRAVGPLGTWMIHATTPDLLRGFEPLLGPQLPQLTHYIHQCNAAKPSGEAAFHTLSEHFAYAKRPMIRRIAELPPNVSMTFIYGSRSWVDAATGARVKALRRDATVEVIVIEGAGHHVHVEQGQLFNHHVIAACQASDARQTT